MEAWWQHNKIILVYNCLCNCLLNIYRWLYYLCNHLCILDLWWVNIYQTVGALTHVWCILLMDQANISRDRFASNGWFWDWTSQPIGWGPISQSMRQCLIGKPPPTSGSYLHVQERKFISSPTTLIMLLSSFKWPHEGLWRVIGIVCYNYLKVKKVYIGGGIQREGMEWKRDVEAGWKVKDLCHGHINGMISMEVLSFLLFFPGSKFSEFGIVHWSPLYWILIGISSQLLNDRANLSWVICSEILL